MWETAVFETKEEMKKWIEKNDDKYQWQEIAVNNAFGILYRKLYIIDLE